MQFDEFQSLARAYCQHSRLYAPDFDDTSCVLMLEDGQPVILAWDGAREDVLIIAPIGAEPARLDEGEAQRLLESAFLGRDFNGAALGLDPHTHALTLWRRLPGEGLTLTRLVQEVANSAASACQMRGR